jgi:malate dehydrogenase
MTDVAILGAGELGGSVATVLAHRDLVRSVTLIDGRGQVAAGKALDIMQVAPVTHFATRVTGSTDVSRVAGAAIVVIADQAGGDEWQGDAGRLLLTQISQLAAGAIIVCAGASQHALIEEAVSALRYAPTRIVGTAPEALASAVRALIALEVNGSARDVALALLGRPPANTVIPWEDVTIGGVAATRRLDEPARRRLAARVAPLWPPGPYALATAAVEAISAIVGRSRRTLSAFVAPGAAAVARTRTAALPVRLSMSGVISVDVPALSTSAQVALDTALQR